MDDELVRTLVWVALVGSACAVVLGGFVSPIAGDWNDQGRRICLRQVACWVRGHAEVEGGQQRFRGLCAFGIARLRRHDSGARHLASLGFRREQWPALDRAVMGHYVLFKRDGGWHGRFVGRRFSFAGSRLHKATRVAPMARALTPWPVTQPPTNGG